MSNAMEDRFNDEERNALSAITNGGISHNRKVHSLSEHRFSAAAATAAAAAAGQKYRKHSLDARHLYNASSSDCFYGNSGRFLATDDAALPEFMASGGAGIFKAPTRAAVHPGRPPAVELRPHPLRETQVGKFLRTIGCTDTQLWAGQESGVRFWNFQDAYEPGSGFGGRVRRGDEDAAPFYESTNTSPTLCLVVDQKNRLVWTGHKDGKIRSWKMDQTLSDDSPPFKEGLSWTAHKGPVLCLVMSSYGKSSLNFGLCLFLLNLNC